MEQKIAATVRARAGGNSRGDRIDVHEDTAELLRQLQRESRQLAGAQG